MMFSAHQFHVSACPNRDSLDRYMYNVHRGTVTEGHPPEQNNFKPFESESSWDNVRLNYGHYSILQPIFGA